MAIKSFRFVLLAVLLSVGILFTSKTVNAQCPMCRASVESAMKEDGNKKGMGLNDGIMYLLALPYVAVAAVGGAWYYNYRKNKNVA